MGFTGPLITLLYQQLQIVHRKFSTITSSPTSVKNETKFTTRSKFGSTQQNASVSTTVQQI